MSYKYNVVANDGEVSSATVFLDNGEMLVATVGHSAFEQIIEALGDGAEEQTIQDLFDIGKAIETKFNALSDRVAIRGDQIYFDGDVQHDVLSERIVTFYHNNLDFMTLVNFMDNVRQNPKDHSRDQLFNWLSKHSFALTPEGHIIAYKRVSVRSGRDRDDYLSSNSGHAIVNGVEYFNQKIPTRPGTIVEMPRSEVDWDPRSACSTGLHAANWNYAKNFNGNVTLRVQINPRDVVSVPTDSGEEKMRCCRYKVLGPVDTEDLSGLYVEKVLGTLFIKQKAPPVIVMKKPKPAAAMPGIIDKRKLPDYVAQAEKAALEAGVTPTPTKPKAVTPKKVAVKKSAAPKVTKTSPKRTSTTNPAATTPQAKPVKRNDKKSQKPVAKTKTKVAVGAIKGRAPERPKYYEQFMEVDFNAQPFPTLRWLAGEWGVLGTLKKKDEIVSALVKYTKKRNLKTETSLK